MNLGSGGKCQLIVKGLGWPFNGIFIISFVHNELRFKRSSFKRSDSDIERGVVEIIIILSGHLGGKSGVVISHN